MIVLDTNVISALIQGVPDAAVVNWLNAQASDAVWTTVVSVFETRVGLAIMAPGRKRQSLEEAFDNALTQMGNQVLPFDAAAANETAAIFARLRAAGRPIDLRDAMIAGIVSAHHGTLATRNTKHFIDAGIPLVNPWATASP
jgi:predicted nucleic acid-binding protein